MTFQISSDSLNFFCTDNISVITNSNVWLGYRTLLINQFYTMDMLISVLPTVNYEPWVWSLVGSVIIGLSGIFPLLVIPIDEGASLSKGANAQSLKVLLSFAVGGLLGDVFLHLLPEAWTIQQRSGNDYSSIFCGSWVLTGLLLFIIAEKIFAFPNPSSSSEEEDDIKVDAFAKNLTTKSDKTQIQDNGVNNNACHFSDKTCYQKEKSSIKSIKPSSKEVAGYLNLMANSIDNFTHGLAVGGSFLISLRVGVLTTFAILVHEVPHEVGDFAILLRAGFSRWDAAKAQLCTASAGIVGALTAVAFSGAGNSVEAKTSWILPFTAGGFLHIALITVLPELIQETNIKESLKQLFSLISGILLMAFLTVFIEE